MLYQFQKEHLMLQEHFLKKKNNDVNLEKEFEFKRIIGIIDQTDIEFAKNNLKLIEDFKSIKVEIYLLDLTNSCKFNIFSKHCYF